MAGPTSSNNLKKRYQQQLTMPGVKEAIREPLYDTLPYDSGVTTQLRFFQTPISGTKTKSDTNMTLAGQLPAGWKFSAEVAELHVLPGSNAASYIRQDPVKSATALAAPNFANDVWALVQAGWAEITIGSKPYGTIPLILLPPMTGLAISAANAVENTNTTVVNQITTDYARLTGRPFKFEPLLPIPGNTNFDITLNWPAAVTLPSGFDANLRFVLQGMRFRDA